MSESDVNIHLDSSSDKSEMVDDIEWEIVGFKQVLNFLKDKIRDIKLDYLYDDYKDANHEDLKQKREQLLELIKKRLLIAGATQNVIRNQFLRTPVMKLKTSDLASQNYKKNIIEQLEKLKTTSEQRKCLHDKQLKILEESSRIKQLIEQGSKLKTNLEEAVDRRKNENQLNLTFKEHLVEIEKRIKKINFMQTITNKLLINGDIDWQENAHLVELIENCRTLCNIEELLD